MSGLSTHPIRKKNNSFWLAFDAFLSWGLGIVMLLAAVPHLENPYYFLGSVYAYRIVEPGIGQVVAMVLPLTQLTLAALLIGRVFINTANFIAMLLFGVFTVVQSLAYFGGLDISCGCFGPENSMPVNFFSISFVGTLFVLSFLRNISVVMCIPIQACSSPKMNNEDTDIVDFSP